jgi:putative ABC transport system permease protein
VFRWLGQLFAVTLVSIRTIPQRLSSSIVAVIGIAGVVVVLVSVLSIGEGFRAAVQGTRSRDCASQWIAVGNDERSHGT